MRMSFCAAIVSGGCLLVGCGPEPAATPDWKPDAAAQQCMELYDKNQDGALSEKEWKESPALSAATYMDGNKPQNYLDENKDGSISMQEVKDRVALYKDRNVVIQFICYVFANSPNQPLPDAKVRLVPEPFLTEFIKPVEASTGPDGMTALSGVQAGLYRVEITHPQLKVAKEFNTETKLGYEVSPVTNPGQSGPPRYVVRVSR